MALPEKFLMDLKMKSDIVEIISGYVQLRRRGNSLVGLCPFHSEKTGSFTVFANDPANPHYYCFGCGAGGDVITFIRSIEHLDYIDAVKFLADRAGMQMPEENAREDYRAGRARILQMNRDAARFFYQRLLSDEGAEARAYIVKRQLTTQTVRHFGIGFAPNSWDSLLRHLRAKGYRDEEIRNAGLCVRGKNGGFYDYFRNRMMVPILDVRGNVIAFGGRVMDDSQPKYLNSPDTLVFKKSHNLFNLNNAKSAGAGRFILAEGYMDVIAMSQAGFKEAVATLGTAITEEQARIIARYMADGEVIVAYDSDAAGQKATKKAIQYLEAAGVKVRVLQMQGGKDPDEYIKNFGADRFGQLLNSSGNQIEYKLGVASTKYNMENEDDKVAYFKEAVEILATIPNAITRDVYAGKLAKELEVSKDSILQEVARSRRAYEKKRRNEAVRAEQTRVFAKRDRINPERGDALRAARAEEGLICILFYHPEMCGRIEELVQPEDFVTEFNRSVYQSIYRIAKGGEIPDTTLLGADYTPEQMGRIMEILTENDRFAGGDETERAIEDFAACIRGERYELKTADIKQKSLQEIEQYLREDLGKRKGKAR